jgi:hypothetical protein
MPSPPGGLQMMFDRDSRWILNVIRLPKVTPRDDVQAQWSHTLPQDFAETLPTAISLEEDPAPEADEPPAEA